MKQPNALLKLAVLASSVLLVGGFISYRAGAFNWLTGTSARTTDSESRPASDKDPSDGSPVGEISPASANSQQPPSSTTPPAPTIMSGSKSMMPSIVIPEPNIPGAPPAAPSQPSPPPQ